MANQLDLEEQEQLDELKHFWSKYGSLISGVLMVVLLGLAGWNGYHYWQRSQAAQASAMFDEMAKSLASADVAKAERTFNDMKDRYASATYTQQAGLALAKMAADAGKAEIAKSALQWVSEKARDDGYAAVAQLRLANLYLDAKQYPEALKALDTVKSDEFAALVADRRGDILLLQGQRDAAKAAYLSAFKAFDERSEYRRLVRVKLNALGVEPEAPKPAATNAANGGN
ncbi:MAG: tetratricopeptide repeat protein [Rhodoferax sp.]|nr:tetratricopeptide repeat protein [Rhodoferax sp.]